MTIVCPICEAVDSQALYPTYSGDCVTSDLQVVPGASLDNRICQSCGFIWNQGGMRGRTEEFYAHSYQLRMHSPTAKNVNFSGPQPKPFAQLVLDYFLEAVKPGERGRLLEVGAGKGEFLTRFVGDRPQWETIAIEPSPAADILAGRLPQTKLIRGGFERIELGETFDTVVAFGVLEHVERPDEMLRWVRRHVSPEGSVLIVVPDFERNPYDLFCADHLSKFTEAHLRRLGSMTGLDVVGTQRIGIAMAVLLRPVVGAASVAEFDLAHAKAVAARNEQLARDNVDAIARAWRDADRQGRGFGIFGLGITGIFAPLYVPIERRRILAYIDENETMHGSSIGGTPVRGLDAIAELNIREIALAVSPVYREQVIRKLSPYGVTVYG